MSKLYSLVLCLSVAGAIALADPPNPPNPPDPPDPPHAAGQLKASLNGASEVPLVLTTGSGQANASVSSDQKSISLTLKFSNLVGVAKSASLYLGLPLTVGGPVAPICGGTMPACPTTASGSVTATIQASDIAAIAAQGLAAGDLATVLTSLMHGELYVNVITDKFPNGEIRGQLGRGFELGILH